MNHIISKLRCDKVKITAGSEKQYREPSTPLMSSTRLDLFNAEMSGVTSGFSGSTGSGTTGAVAEGMAYTALLATPLLASLNALK